MQKEPFDFDQPAVLLLNSLRNVLTESVKLQHDSRLEVVLAEAVTGEQLEDIGPVKGVKSITIQPQSRRFVFQFTNFISYAVTEETFWQPDIETVEAKERKGWVRRLTHSPFLNFVRASSWADQYSDDPLLHFQLVTLDHTIDVVTIFSPVFSLPATL